MERLLSINKHDVNPRLSQNWNANILFETSYKDGTGIILIDIYEWFCINYTLLHMHCW